MDDYISIDFSRFQRSGAAMSEVQFAKSFMSVLDRRAVKLGSDFVSDPKKYPAQSPVSIA